jgi:3-dehydroquinate synthase
VRTVRVALGARSYDIVIGHGLLDEAGERLGPYARGGRLVVVTDETVWAAQGARLAAGLGPTEAVPVAVAPGEGSKSWASLEALVDRLLALGVERGDHVVAFGGGVIGDLAGFAAAIVKRGCNLVQVPTTLLAQVDSSVGGKTGINAAAGKNLVGAFHQPALVLIDPSCLATLEPRHMRSGYAEIAKYALAEDRPFFERLETGGEAVLSGDPEPLAQAIAAAVAGKARIVAEDERETNGRRALLNLGHTFGHALEAETGFSGRLLHGEAVAIGIVLAFDLSAELGLCPAGEALRVRAHLAKAGLPTTLEAAGLRGRAAPLIGHIRSDKKAEAGRIVLILARGIGEAFVERGVDEGRIEAFLDRHD